MYDTSIFTSDFWSWFIIIPTALGIVGLFWLILWQSGGRPKPDEEVKTMGHVWDDNLEELNNPLPMWWLNMFYITLVFGIIYLILFPGMGAFKGILGWTSTAQYNQEMDAADSRYSAIYAKYGDLPIPELVNNADAVQIGERMYITYCTVCHGSDAQGNVGFPNLRDDDWLWGGSAEAIRKTIIEGRIANMPNAQTNGLATEQDIHNVAHYVMSLSGNQQADQAAAEEGAKIFNGICVACHMPAGTGMQALGAPNLTDDIWLYGGSEEAIKETLRHGRQGQMPAFSEFLGEDRVHLLATYVYSLQQKETEQQ